MFEPPVIGKWTIPPSNGSFNWSLIDKPRSLILPRCEWFDIEIASSILINALYLPSLRSLHLSGSAIIRPLPNIRAIAPLCSSISIDLWYQFKDVLSAPRVDEREVKQSPIVRTRPHHLTIMEQASPCPLPASSIIDNILIDEIIATLSTSSPSSSATPPATAFASIRIQMRNGYLTLSQLRRLIDAITNDNIKSWTDTWEHRLELFVPQPLIFDNITSSNAMTVALTASSGSSSSLTSYLKVKDDYIIASIMDIIKQISRWLLPRSLSAQIVLPRIGLSSHQMESLTQQCLNTFGSLLRRDGADEPRLGIRIGDHDMQHNN
jgi:hypothetical protein